MREKGGGRQRWFSIDSKSFEFTVEGEGRHSRVIITERSRGQVSWIRFGEEGAKILLKGVESLKNEEATRRRGYGWKENGRSFSMVYKRNDAGYFILCSVLDVDGKGHCLFSPEGKGQLNGWGL